MSPIHLFGAPFFEQRDSDNRVRFVSHYRGIERRENICTQIRENKMTVDVIGRGVDP